MSKSKSCKLYPEINGKPSKTYKEFLEKAKLKRPLTNYLYVAYTTSPDMANKMDAAGYQRNSQGEHSASDILKFIDFSSWQHQLESLSQEEWRAGFTDTTGKRVDFTNAREALEKADDFNNTHTGIVATVVQHGDVYNIIGAEKNAYSHTYPIGVKQKLQVWDVYKQVFNGVGVDLESMPASLSNVVSANNTNLVQQLRNFRFMGIQDIYKRDAELLFNLSANSPQVQRLVREFGSIENAAQFIDDVNHGAQTPTARQKLMVVEAITEAKKFNNIDLDALKTQVDQMMKNISQSSPEEAIKDTLHKLNKKYRINVYEIHKVNSKINSLSDAAIEALFSLQRQIRELQRHEGNNAEGKRLEGIISQLMKELDSKRYYLGMTKFLGEAGKQIAEIDNLLNNLPQTGTELEKVFETAKILQDIDKIKTQYYDLVSALSNENLTIDESINQVDIDNVRNTARTLKDFFDKRQKLLENLAESTMFNLMTQIVSNETPDGQAMINAVRMAAVDSNAFNYLYSIGRAQNPVVAAMGSIIRNAQDERNGILNDMSIRIKKATNKLYDSGSTSEFMYEDDGHIISDIDWGLYEAQKEAEAQRLWKKGLRGFDLKQAIEAWEEANTEDREVDHNNGRTERVPNSNYRKAFPQLSAAQQEYYDTMMQLKGEIGSLLPSYAQHQYLPPQVRRKMFDALGNAKSVHDVWKAVRNKAENLVKVREDDQNYGANGIIDGDPYQLTQGAFDNTPLKQIPIFFVNRVEEGELLKNFSTGIQALAGTAINYDAMNNIVDVVEFIGNFVKGQAVRADTKQADLVENATLRVIKDLRKAGRNSNTENIVDSFINQYVYGQYRTDSSKGFAKAVDSLIQYTSFKGLATNLPGATANYLMGEFQMMVEAGAGEFYGIRDYMWAHSKLFGSSGVTGEMWDLLNETRNSKSKLFNDLFDPESENFESKSHQAYHKSMFRKLLSHDLSFIGYGSGEYLIHYVNMYAVLHKQKVKLNGKTIPLYDAFEVTEKQDGVAELKLKDGVTRIDGSAVTQEFIDGVKKKIRYVNQTCHGAMNKEDKGLIYQKWYGRLAMNFRQWMVEHYSRRFRGRHFDASLGENREGYWVSVMKLLESDESREMREQGRRWASYARAAKDLARLNWNMKTNWHNLKEDQKSNCKRALTEFALFVALNGLSFALGEPDEHKKEFWRRWWIYQTRRMLTETEASMPVTTSILGSFLTIMNSPFASISTMNSILYLVTGILNGDIAKTIQSGDHKGENRYIRNVQKYVLPFYKDIERMQTLDKDDTLFKVFEKTPTNR